MRRNILSNVGRAATAGPQQAIRRSPFVCAYCRRAALQASQEPLHYRRTFSTSIARSQQASTASAPSTQRESILPQTHYDFFPQTFPNGPPPNSPFTPDLRQLRKEYLQLQSKSHPDIVPQARKRHAEAISMRLNEAYKTIQEPLHRARYLLALQGIDVEDESAQISDNELLMEVMEVREAVDEAKNEEELVEIRATNTQRIDKTVRILEDAFARGDVNLAAEEAIKLRYWANIEESIQGWEKGRGGGILHH